MAFLIVMLSIMCYGAVGTLAARHQYALAKKPLGAGGEEVERARNALKRMQHGSDCWRGSYYNSKDRDCDCGNRIEWKRLTRLAGGEMKMPNPYYMVFGWPVLGFDAFLRSKTITNNGVDADYIASLERRLEIGKE
jgi:hypothetical protein